MRGDGKETDEGTPVDTPRGEEEWNGQNKASKAVEDASTAVSDVSGGRREEVACCPVSM